MKEKEFQSLKPGEVVYVIQNSCGLFVREMRIVQRDAPLNRSSLPAVTAWEEDRAGSEVFIRPELTFCSRLAAYAAVIRMNEESTNEARIALRHWSAILEMEKTPALPGL